MKSTVLKMMTMIGTIAILAVSGRSEGPQYTAWSALEPVTAVNTAAVELVPRVSHDGLRMYFFRNGDLYVSHRSDDNADWQAPIALSAINTADVETTPFESDDGHWLFFGSTRPGGAGGVDIWVSYRRFVHDDNAWQAPVNVAAVNSAGFEGGPMLFEDDESGLVQLYFASTPYPGGPQALADLYVSTLGPTGFGPPVPITELNSDALDGGPWLRRDGLEIYYLSYREGLPLPYTYGSIYNATRGSLDEPWSAPEVVIGRQPDGSPGDHWVTTPCLSHDGLTLYVAANQPGTDIGDIFVAHRMKLTGRR